MSKQVYIPLLSFISIISLCLPSVDNAANFLLAPIEGHTLIISGAADSSYGTAATAGYAYAAQYNVQDMHCNNQ
jgi:hypothetical protein